MLNKDNELLAKTETHAESARVSMRFADLDAAGTKKIFDTINQELTSVACEVTHTLKRMTPQLSLMQSLLSQRGAARRKVLAQAGLPTWSEYAASYAEKLDCSVRTIQARITELRRGRVTKRITPAQPDKPTPASEPDWRDVLSGLVYVIEQCNLPLPTILTDQTRRAKALLDGLPEGSALPAIRAGQCSGCADMHEGIVNIANAHPKWNDQKLADASGCGITIVRQAKTRFGVGRKAA